MPPAKSSPAKAHVLLNVSPLVDKPPPFQVAAPASVPVDVHVAEVIGNQEKGGLWRLAFDVDTHAHDPGRNASPGTEAVRGSHQIRR